MNENNNKFKLIKILTNKFTVIAIIVIVAVVAVILINNYIKGDDGNGYHAKISRSKAISIAESNGIDVKDKCLFNISITSSNFPEQKNLVWQAEGMTKGADYISDNIKYLEIDSVTGQVRKYTPEFSLGIADDACPGTVVHIFQWLLGFLLIVGYLISLIGGYLSFSLRKKIKLQGITLEEKKLNIQYKLLLAGCLCASVIVLFIVSFFILPALEIDLPMGEFFGYIILAIFAASLILLIATSVWLPHWIKKFGSLHQGDQILVRKILKTNNVQLWGWLSMVIIMGIWAIYIFIVFPIIYRY